jgi:hypothetical protein
VRDVADMEVWIRPGERVLMRIAGDEEEGWGCGGLEKGGIEEDEEGGEV